MRDWIAKKVNKGQARRIVLNLTDYRGTLDDVKLMIERNRAVELADLEEILVVNRESVLPPFPW